MLPTLSRQPLIYILYEYGNPRRGYVGATAHWYSRKKIHFLGKHPASYFAAEVRARGGCLVFQVLEQVPPDSLDRSEADWINVLQKEGYKLVNKEHNAPYYHRRVKTAQQSNPTLSAEEKQ